MNERIEAARQAAAWLHRYADKLEAGDTKAAEDAALLAAAWWSYCVGTNYAKPKNRILRTEPPLTDLPHDGNDNAARR